jgi:autotransporter-associated beta strand protein
LVNGANSDVLALGGWTLTPGAGHDAGILYVGGFDNNYTITGSLAGAIKSATPNNNFSVNVFTGTLTVNAGLNAGSAATLKYGAGTLVIGGNNTSSGQLYVLAGTARLTHNNAAGTTAGGIIVQNGAALELADGVNIGAEAITATGHGIANGGALSNYSGTNTYGGVITVGAGGMRIGSASGLLNLTNSIVTSLYNDLYFGGPGDIAVSNRISGSGRLIKDGTGTLTLTTNNTYSGATLINEGNLVGVVGGGCANSALTVTSLGILEISVTDNTKWWTCSSLALNDVSQVRFVFIDEPSESVAPLKITGTLKFSGLPEIAILPLNIKPGLYPLLTVGGPAITQIPTLKGIYGKLYWGGPNSKTLFLRVDPAGTIIRIR